MTYKGFIDKGIVRLIDSDLPDGTEVRVEPVRARTAAATKRKAGSAQRRGNGALRARTVAERLATIVGAAKNLPRDLSRRHDHYLYGAPKGR